MARCDSYDYGECTRGACQEEPWVPDGLGNANQWLARARALGYLISDVPTIDAIAVFNDARLYDPTYGHVAAVRAVYSYTDFAVREMNYTAFNRFDARDANRTGLLGFIIPPGVAVGSPGPQPGVVLPADQQLSAAWASVQGFWNDEIRARWAELAAWKAAGDGIK